MTILKLNKENFDEIMGRDGTLLVDFYAEWCGPCKMMRSILEEASQSVKNAKIASVNIDEENELAERYEISSIPCLILFRDGKEVERNVGLISGKEVERMLGK